MVVSDLEGTLTTGASGRAIVRYLLRRGYALPCLSFALRRLPLLLGGLRSSRRPLFVTQPRDLARALQGMSQAELGQLADWVVERELWPKRRHDVIAALKAHQAAGERLLLASSVYQPILERFAHKLAAEALGTQLEVCGGRLTGRLVGEVNVGEVKAKRLHERLGAARLYAAYGDAGADAPMLMLSDRPVAVYPDQALRSTASALGWRVLEHR